MTTSIARSVSAAKLGQGTQSPVKQLKHRRETGNHAVEGTLEYSFKVYQMCYYKHVIGGFYSGKRPVPNSNIWAGSTVSV